MSEGLNVNVEFQYADGFQLKAAFASPGGAITSLIGPSGSGKSTLLSLLCGLRDPVSGEIKIGDRTLFSDEASINVPTWDRNVGLLFQQDTLFPHLNVRKNLRFGAKEGTESQWKMDDIVNAFEIETLLDRKPDELSGGQRDRVALGRTLLSQPKLLLLDEPLSSVEGSLRNAIFDFVRGGVQTQAIPTLLVSHDSNLLSRVAGPTLQMKAGLLSP